MAIAPTFRRTPLKSMLDFAADREREANSIGNVIDQITKPILGGMGVQPEEMMPQPAVLRGPAPQAQPLGAFTGPPMAPTLVQDTVTPEFMDRLFMQESGYNPNAVSPKGAVGTGQVLPSTAMDPGYGVPTIFDLADEQGVDYGGRTRAEAERLLFNDDLNRQFSTIYANAMANEFGGDPALTAAAYNAGPGAVAAYGGVPPFAETQNYVRALTGGAGDSRMGGGAGGDTLGGGMNVEDILARLYPEMTPEEERRTRRQDIMAGAGDVLMGLSQGRSADISAIRAQQEARKRQAVLDMRERERARAAASLVYSQTGDADLATGIATGAISYSDVLSERQLRRAQELADEQKIREAESAQAVADAMKGTGLFKDEDIANVAANKLDPNTLFGIYEKAQVAEKLAEDDLNKAEIAAQNVIDAQTILSTAAPGSVEARAAERVIALGGSENVYDLITARTPASADTKVLGPNERLVSGTGEIIATGITPPSGAGGEVADIAKANMLFEGGALNPATNQPFTSPAEALAAIQFYKTPSAAAGGVSLQYTPEGGFTFTQGAPVTGGAANGVVDVAKPEAGTATVVQDGQLTSVPIAGAIAPEQAATDLAAAQQALAERIAAAPSALEKARLENEKLRLDIQAAQATQGVDEATKAAQLANLEAEAAKKQAEVAALEKAEAQQSSAAYSNAVREFSVMEEAVNKIIPNAQDFWVTGLGAVAGRAGAALGLPTERSSFLEAAKQLGSQAMLTALAEAKAAGVTLTPVSNLDVSALGASQSRLSMPENLTGEDILKETVFQYNYAKDALYGPRDLTRYDDFGQPYQLGENTLGVTEDTFVRHWANIPPEVAEAWRTGAIAALPTDDPLYAEAASTINEMVTNWETFQGDLDRTKVGIPEDDGEPVDMADLPPAPEGFPADEWADTWANMSEAAREAYRKKTEGAQ